ncbi:hypothetical protein F5Y14DRAFT_86256 [Nemania sp. NC0429]|nr:hypothetical protein F5Y14DRAFT_86256 [Nemania sp. NC0429]
MRVLSTIVAISGTIAVALAIPGTTTEGVQATATTTTNGTVDSFADTCESYRVHQSGQDVWLGGYCRNSSNEQPYSSLNLNHCIANDFGKMAARDDGNFAQSCNRMVIRGARPILWAYCNNGRYPEETVIDLGDFVDNDNGRLHCFGHYDS